MWDMNVLISLGTVLCFLYSLMASGLQFINPPVSQAVFRATPPSAVLGLGAHQPCRKAHARMKLLEARLQASRSKGCCSQNSGFAVQSFSHNPFTHTQINAHH